MVHLGPARTASPVVAEVAAVLFPMKFWLKQPCFNSGVCKVHRESCNPTNNFANQASFKIPHLCQNLVEVTIVVVFILLAPQWSENHLPQHGIQGASGLVLKANTFQEYISAGHMEHPDGIWYFTSTAFKYCFCLKCIGLKYYA
jgi:hypothetical protein